MVIARAEMAANRSIALRLQRVTKSYDSVTAIRDLTFEVVEGRFFVLFGPSSVGKTTTLRTIAGLVRPDAGTLEIAGKDMTHAPIAGRGVAMVFQSFALYPHLTVYDNFAYPLREEKRPRAEIDQRVLETAEMLHLTPRLRRKPATLSGGEQQRAALGRAMIRRPKILLLDEPLTNLDAKLRHEMRAELKRLHRQFGMTIIYATPDELEALSMGEEIAVLRDGTVVQRGTPDELYDTPADVYVASKIGSPHMNLIEAVANDSGTAIDTPFGSVDLPHSATPFPAGERVVLGVRPADLKVVEQRSARATPVVQLLEPLGDLTVVSLTSGSETYRILLSEAQAAAISVGETLPITIDSSKIHLFRGHDGLPLRG
jgi:multiple sugar transport system ATP-binding protein